MRTHSYHYYTEEVKRSLGTTLTVVVDDGSAESVGLQHGELLQSRALGDVVAGLDQLLARDKVVHLDPGPEVRNLPPPGREETSPGVPTYHHMSLQMLSL